MCVLYIGWCLYSLILVFIHLFDFFFFPSTNQSNSRWTSRLGFHIGFFFKCSVFLSIRLLKPTFLFFVFCVCVEVNGGKLSVIRFMQSWEWANAAIAEVAIYFTLIELPGLEGFLKGWIFMVDMFLVICHKIIPTELFTGLNT